MLADFGYTKQAVILAIIFIGFVVFIFVGLDQRKRELEKNPIFVTAVIVDKYVGAKRRDYVRYELNVDGKVVDGHQAEAFKN